MWKEDLALDPKYLIMLTGSTGLWLERSTRIHPLMTEFLPDISCSSSLRSENIKIHV
jgi:hypothetical protein